MNDFSWFEQDVCTAWICTGCCEYTTWVLHL